MMPVISRYEIKTLNEDVSKGRSVNNHNMIYLNYCKISKHCSNPCLGRVWCSMTYFVQLVAQIDKPLDEGDFYVLSGGFIGPSVLDGHRCEAVKTVLLKKIYLNVCYLVEALCRNLFFQPFHIICWYCN